MGRKKGSLNKNTQPIQLNFEDNQKEFDEKTEICMTNAIDTTELEQIQTEIDLARVELEKTRLEIEENKLKLKESPVQVKSIESPAITSKDNAALEKIAAQKALDNVMVTGKFYNLRVKGKSEKLTYHKYADDPVKWWDFDHGKVYTIPKGFADQINGGTESDPHHYTPHFIKNEGIILNPDEPESGIHAVDTSDKKFSFVPLNF
jgi:hypothetical protein